MGAGVTVQSAVTSRHDVCASRPEEPLTGTRQRRSSSIEATGRREIHSDSSAIETTREGRGVQENWAVPTGAIQRLRCSFGVGPAFTILFVDDDQHVLAVIAEALSAKGFRVLATDNGYDALRLIAEDYVDVLFTDVVMPGINGIELAKQAKLLNPALKVMLETAYFSRAAEASAIGKLLFKPLRADQIETEIRDLLSA
jgi:CheY-like chemotaxis protein